MSEAHRTPTMPQHGGLSTSRARFSHLSALEALEGGFALFRSTFGREAWRYYAGAAPFVIAFIPMWVANGQIRISDGMLLLEAALLAAAYILRVWMISVYMQRVRESAFGVPAPTAAGLIGRAAALSHLIASKIAFTFAALAGLGTVVGTSWIYSASQFASVDARDDNSQTNSIRGCLKLSSQWFGSGLLFLAMLVPLWSAVWLNGLIVALIVPQLLHSILGVNTLLSTAMGMFALIRSSAFWLALFAAAWLAIDPVVKCSFVVVHQHLKSRREGDDLRGLLAGLPRTQQRREQMVASTSTGRRVAVGVLLAVTSLLAGSFSWPIARATQLPLTQSGSEPTLDRRGQIEKLRHALDEESKRAIYRWHDAAHPTPPTWLDRQLEKIGIAITRIWNAIADFFRKLWPRGFNLSSGENGRGTWRMKNLWLWIILVAIVTLTVTAVLLWLRRRQQAEPLSIPMQVAPLPDLGDTVIATARSEDEWFALASRLQREGELRLAVRASYLGLLAGLGQRQWLSIRRDRTNREYLDEFVRRWGRRPSASLDARTEIPEKLRGSLRHFDGVWYGFRQVTPDFVIAYQRDQLELLSHV